MMTSEEWHDVLTLLTIVILADRRVYKEEVDTFVKVVKLVNDQISPETFMTEGMVFDWFKSNRERVGKLLVGKDVDRNINQAIHGTRNLPKKSIILAAMQSIAESDSDVHKNELNIIKRTANGWHIPIPG